MNILKRKKDSKFEDFNKKIQKYLKNRKLLKDYKKSKGIEKVFKWIELKVKGV